MKKRASIILIAMSALLLAPTIAFAQSNSSGKTTQERLDEETRRDHLKLINQRKSTRSVGDVVVEAIYDGKDDLEIFVMDYSGTVTVQIVGGRTSLQNSFNVYEMGCEIFDVSGLRAGSYTLRIILDDDEFEGILVKATTGR